MKKIIISLLLSFFFLLDTSYAINIKIISSQEMEKLQTEVTRAEVFSYFANFYKKNIPETYKYIDLKIKDIQKETPLYENIQILVYLDLIKNKEVRIYPNRKMNLYFFNTLSEKILWTKLFENTPKSELKEKNTTQRDLEKLGKTIKEKLEYNQLWNEINDIWWEVEIFKDVYETLLKKHYDRKNISEKKLIYSAIEWLTKWVGDKHTIYFPPVKNKDFEEAINGEYEGIGSYVEMTEPWKMIIVSPIVGSPSEKVWIKWWDRIMYVDGKEITKEVSLREAVSWIKWPKGTTVSLTILRKNKTLKVEVTREKIIVKNIEYSLPKYNTFYIQIKSFGPNVFEEFTQSLDVLEKKKGIKKIIIDLRNNPGGYLDQVSAILGYFVPKWEKTAIVDYGIKEQSYKSAGFEKIDFSKYKIVFLQNSGTASASEIMIGTVKDYYPKSIIIGEKSYGKWSVQTIKHYYDGSSLKITVAKWFTGKTRTGIDGIGITPDIELELDTKKYVKWIDNQLKEALRK